MGKNRFLGIVAAGALALAVLGGCGKDAASDVNKVTEEASKEAGLTFTKEEDGIEVSLVTDKSKYKAGEELHYTLTVTNNKKDYTVSRIYVSADNAKDFGEIGTPQLSANLAPGASSTYEGTLIAFSDTPIEAPKAAAKTMDTGDIKKVKLRPYLNVNYGGQELLVRYKVDVVMYQNRVEVDSALKKKLKTVACHDPSIVVGQDNEGKKCYYIFGSHRAWCKSYDLQNWEYFTNNLSKDYRNILAEPAAWSSHGSNNYKVDGYMWAPDVIYNKDMGKWCMYLSVDGEQWYSSIVLLTADTLEGDWTYEGIVVYSGFRTEEFYDETDVAAVTGETAYPTRYKNKKWGDFYPNNIDACVFYDDDGNLWMSYGSWSGGIFMLALDEATGLRDMSVTYEDSIHSDPYFGKKIAGGRYVSGEASYIQKIGDYYYLFMSYGGLEAKGGYNIRVFRSERPDGDYVDALGNDPYFDVYKQNFNMSVGVRLFGGYKFRFMTQGQVAQGHNSAFVDDDGRAYIVFHTRTTDGSEAHYVKTHQLFVNEDGWLVAAPYQTSDEKLNASDVSADKVAGDYDVILHEMKIDYANLGVSHTKSLTLEQDGTVSGDMTGSWELAGGECAIHLTLDGVNYHGKVLMMEVEGTTVPTMVFTALGVENQLTLWGSKLFD